MAESLMPVFALLLICLVTVTLCRNVDELPDCNNLGCPVDVQTSPVCGTDGNTYTSQCHMELVNQKRICWIGHFNMIYKLHDGPCAPTTPVVITG